jgi:hypothetical protein
MRRNGNATRATRATGIIALREFKNLERLSAFGSVHHARIETDSLRSWLEATILKRCWTIPQGAPGLFIVMRTHYLRMRPARATRTRRKWSHALLGGHSLQQRTGS